MKKLYTTTVGTVGVALAVALSAGSSRAGQQVVLEPDKDNTLFEDPAGSLSNGAGSFVLGGRTGTLDGGRLKRALLHFDVTGSVPAGATITSASLQMHMRMTVSGPTDMPLHRVLQDWGEAGSVALGGGGATALQGDATWIHTSFSTQSWASAGGDFTPAASATRSVDGVGFYTWSSAQLTADAQAMLDTPATNFGWLLRGEESVLMTAKMFSSREHFVPAERPLLTIDYTLPTVSYCTAGTSAGGCQAVLSTAGVPSATAASGFLLDAAGVEGQRNGIYLFGTGGRQALPWGSGTSYQCVVPPVKRAGVLLGAGTSGACDGAFAQDLNALWCPTCPKPGHNPGAGAVVQAQLWYRDPVNTSDQTTSLSDAVEFTVCP